MTRRSPARGTRSPGTLAPIPLIPFHGAELEGDDYDGAGEHALLLAANGTKYVSAYNAPHVIAGQGTLVGEVADSLGEDFTIVVPTGSGDCSPAPRWAPGGHRATSG